MAKNDNKKEKACQGRYYVSGYETADGKKVDGYYRTCWKHGTNGNSVQETDTLDDTINGPYYPKTLPTKANDGLPLPSPNTPGKINTGQSHPVWDIISQTIGVASDIFLAYMAYQAAANKNIRDLVIGKENDTEIDSKNNAIGRQIYLQNPNASEQELIDIVYEGIKNGVKYNVKYEDKKIPWQDFLYFLNNYTYKIKNK